MIHVRHPAAKYETSKRVAAVEHNRVRRARSIGSAPAGYGGSGKSPARAVGSFVPRLTRKVFEKFGFSAASLITDWERIAGADVAAWCQPERLRWPRQAGEQADAESRRAAATLLLRVDPARALDIQYRQRQITERINAYFGYRAIGEIRILQAPLDPQLPSRPPALARRHIPQPAAPDLAQVGDDNLRAALQRLHASVIRG